MCIKIIKTQVEQIEDTLIIIIQSNYRNETSQ